MKASLLTGVSVGALVLASGAQARDLTPRLTDQAPAPWSWTGFYLGGTVGAASERSTISNDPLSSAIGPVLPGSVVTGQTGVIGGLEAGYNAQVSNIVVGIEGDISWASLNRSVSTTDLLNGATDTYSSSLNELSTFRGRLGWAVDRTLFYGTAGVAIAELKDQLYDPGYLFTVNPNSNVTGWVAGGGIEYALWDHWTVKAEYLHVGLPNRTAVSNTNGYAFDFKDSLDIGRVGINYKF